MKNPATRPAPGFTLIEMLTVVFIIIILAGLGVTGLGFVTERQNKAKAQIDISLLSKAIEDYYSDNGQYPGLDEDTDEKGDVSDELYNALFYDGYEAKTGGDPTLTAKIYLVQLDPRDGTQTLVAKAKGDTVNADLKILDPWKRSYRYRKGNNAQNPDFDLWSMGKDGLSNFTNPDRNIEENADDIRNF